MSGKREALIIASYEYEDESLGRLIAPSPDAEDLAGVLSNPQIGDFNVKVLRNRPSPEINEEIDGFFAERHRDDLLLLYFSCHGIKDKNGRLYFAAANTKRRLLASTAIASSFVNQVMRDSRSQRKVLLLDCCYAGAFARGMSAKADKTVGAKWQFEQAAGLVVLAASDEWQYSFEGDTINGTGVRSVFTRSLVHGLKTGEADRDQDGSVSFDELYDYTLERVMAETSEQRPQKWILGGSGSVLIARNPFPVPTDRGKQKLESREPEAEPSVPRLDESEWSLLLKTITHQKCVPFVGPGAYFGSFPPDRVIAQEWARQHDYHHEDHRNLPKVAGFLAEKRGPLYPHELIQRRLQNVVPPDFTQPDELHSVLAALPLPVFITTNYDEFLMLALKAQNKEPVRDFCRWNNRLRDQSSILDEVEPTVQNPLVFHLYGYCSLPESMVLTENDYREFLTKISAEPNRLPPRIREAIVGSSLLFIGYSLTGLKFRTLTQALDAFIERNYQHRFVSYERSGVEAFAAQLRSRWESNSW